MKIIGCDFHTRYQQIAMMDEATGELIERRLDHESGEAQAFYRDLQGPVRVGIEATGPIRWFERLLAELDHELWIGDSAKIRASRSAHWPWPAGSAIRSWRISIKTCGKPRRSPCTGMV